MGEGYNGICALIDYSVVIINTNSDGRADTRGRGSAALPARVGRHVAVDRLARDGAADPAAARPLCPHNDDEEGRLGFAIFGF